MKLHLPGTRLLLVTIARFFLILAVSLSVAAALNLDTYKDLSGKRLFKLHTSDLKALADQMTIKLNFFLSQGNREGVQSVLNASFGLFGFVVTDCRTEMRACPGQNILYTSDLSLPWNHPPHIKDLASGSFALLRRPPGVIPLNEGSDPDSFKPGEIIGRLYVISNMPHSFTDDYLEWLKSPFADVGGRRFYLRTTVAFLAGSLIIWIIAELYFMIRRKQSLVLLERESELKQSVNRQMKQLAEKDVQITRLNEQSGLHYEAYVAKIRALNLKVRDEEEYRELAEQIIAELESDKAREKRINILKSLQLFAWIWRGFRRRSSSSRRHQRRSGSRPTRRWKRRSERLTSLICLNSGFLKSFLPAKSM